MKSNVYRYVVLSTLILLPYFGASQTISIQPSKHSVVESRFLVTVNDEEDVIQITLTNTKTAASKLIFKTSEGKIFRTEDVKLWNGNSVFYFEKKEFNPGTYILTIEHENESITTTFVL